MRLRSLAFGILAWLPWFGTSAGEELTIAVYDYPPLGIVNGEKRPGYCYDIAERIFSGYGYEVTARFQSLPRAIREVERQEIDLLCTITKFHSTRLRLGPVPNATLKFHFWKARGSDFEFTDMQSLKGRMVINIVGFNYTGVDVDYQQFVTTQKEQVLNLAGSQPLRRAFRLIARGRADTIGLDYANAAYNLRQLGMQDDFVSAGAFGQVLEAFPAVSREHPKGERLLAEFTEGYLRLKGEGEVARIVQRYLDPLSATDGDLPPGQ